MRQDAERGSTSLAIKAGFWYVLSSFMIKALAFITTPLFSRLMSVEAYGEFSNFASWRSTLLIITGAELYNTLGRAYYDFKDEYDEYVSSVTFLSSILTVAFYVIFLIFKKWILTIVVIPEQYIHILFLTLMMGSCKLIYLARERTLYRYRAVAIMSGADILIPTIISVVLVIIAGDADKLSARIYGFYIPSLIIGLACGLLLIARGKAFRIVHCKYAFKLALPLFVHYLTVYLLTSTNTIIAKNLSGASVAAIVSIAISVLHIVTVLFQALTGAVTTWLMDNLERKRLDMIRRETLLYILILVAVAVGVILLAPEIVWILGGERYLAATALIPGLVASALIQAIVSLFTIILTYDKNLIKVAAYTGIVTVLSIFIKVLLFKKLGVQSLPYTNLATYIVLFIIHYLLVWKAGYASAINLKGICLCMATVLVLMVMSNFLYTNSLIRYIVTGIIGIAAILLVYRKRETLSRLFKKS